MQVFIVPQEHAEWHQEDLAHFDAADFSGGDEPWTHREAELSEGEHHATE
jgi:hypothetical protein